jgi:type VI secretion system secreted protein Hcp
MESKRFPALSFRNAVWLVAVCVITVTLATLSASAQQTIYMRIGGVVGESKDAAHKDWIEVSSLQLGTAMPSGGATPLPAVAVKDRPQPRDQSTGIPTGKAVATPRAVPAVKDRPQPRDQNAGIPTGRSSVQSITIVKKPDTASPVFRQALASQQRFPEVILDIYSGGRHERQIVLTNAQVSSIQENRGREGQPTESISLNFTKIEYKYDPKSSHKYDAK